MELRQLDIVRTVADVGTITGAAAKLHVAQPAVTSQLHALEAEIGHPLFDRLPRGVRLTAVGQAVLVHARRIFRELDQMAIDVDELAGLQRGHLTVGSIPTITTSLIPTAIVAFHQAFPSVVLTVEEARSGDLMTAVSEHRVDLAILSSMEPMAGVYLEPLWDEELAVVIPPEDPLATRKSVRLKELAHREFLMLEVGFGLRTLLLDACRKTGFTPKVVMTMESIQSIKSLVQHGFGISVIPRATASLEIELGLLKAIRLQSPRLSRPVQIATAQGVHPSPAVQAFIHICYQLVDRQTPNPSEPDTPHID